MKSAEERLQRIEKLLREATGHMMNLTYNDCHGRGTMDIRNDLKGLLKFFAWVDGEEL